ncbi:MAG: AAA family ATPase, partial [Alphaproteobacteria bacterium]|nr:AAA family ATPase [Alphaproteobacteria bacterium]
LVSGLSGGEKARLLFCLMSFDAPHIMLLDEPTNHLDIDAREALMQALNNYSGAVILVSHDPHLVECVADQLWLVADGKCKAYDGDLDTYRKLVIKQRKLEREKLRQETRAPKTDGAKESAADPEAEAQRLEALLADLNQRRHNLEGEMAELFGDKQDAGRLKKLQAAYEDLQKETAATEIALAQVIACL